MAATSDVSQSALGQGLQSLFEQNVSSALFSLDLNGLSSADGSSLSIGGQAIQLQDGSGGDTESQPLLVDAENNLPADQRDVPDSLLPSGTSDDAIIVPMNGTIELRTAHDDLTETLLTETPATNLSPDAGGGNNPPPVVAADFFFDGTGNDGNVDSQGASPTDSNVWKMFKADTQTTIPALYFTGVGTIATNGGHIGATFGGIGGLGADQILSKAWNALYSDVQKGANTIDIVGFSRGSAEALEFLNRIADALSGTRNQILKVDAAGHPILSGRVNTYYGLTDVKVRFVGLFDTVTSFAGAAGYTEDKRAYIPTTQGFSIQEVVHAVALGEHREKFPWTNLSQGDATNFLQVGFRGAHSDVGGGYGNADGLTNITLHWMITRAADAIWSLSNYYPQNADNYDLTQQHNSQFDGIPYWIANDAIQRTFPANLLCWTPGPTIEGTLVPFGSQPLKYWDYYWWDVAIAFHL